MEGIFKPQSKLFMLVTEFNAIYNRHYQLVFNYVQKRLDNNYQLAEDITVFVFMKLWEQSPAFESDKHIGVWLIKIASNRVVDTFRRIKFRRLSLTSIEGMELADSIAIEKRMTDRDTLKHIFTIEKTLPPRQKELFELYFMRDLPSKQIAEMLHTADQSVRNQIFTLRQKIKANLPQRLLS